MKNRLFVNNNTIILFLFIIGSFLFIELNFRYWYRFLEQYMMFQTTAHPINQGENSLIL